MTGPADDEVSDDPAVQAAEEAWKRAAAADRDIRVDEERRRVVATEEITGLAMRVAWARQDAAERITSARRVVQE